jgi:hypothetical protein
MFSTTAFIRYLVLWLGHPVHLIGTLLLVVLSVLAIIRKPEQAMSRERRVILTYALVMSPLFLFYQFVRASSCAVAEYPRYWVAFGLCLTLLVMYETLHWRIEEGRAAQKRMRKFFFTGPLLLFCLTAITFTISSYKRTHSRWLNRADCAFAGALTERFIPQDISMASSEMNTFGLMIRRPVIDLWGYSNPSIAAAQSFSAARVRNNPNAFLESRPDVFWLFWFTHDPDVYTFEVAEKGLAYEHAGKQFNILGDMHDVLRDYELMMLHANGWQVAYLVRKSICEKLLDHLEREGFELKRSRAIDQAAFAQLYDAQTLKQYKYSK